MGDLKGKVKKWIKSQGYGFIQAEQSKEDLLVHHSDLSDTYDLVEGQKVEFQIDQTSPRPKAIQVKTINEPPTKPE